MSYSKTTWANGGAPVISAANLQKIEDKLEQLSTNSLSVVKYKAANETVNNSTTFQDDDDLQFAIAANEIWMVKLVLIIAIISTTNSWKGQISVPSGSVVTGLQTKESALTGTPSYAHATQLIAISGGSYFTASPYYNGSSGNPNTIVELLVINGSTPGTFKLQWAQLAAVAEDTKLLAGSFLVAHRVGSI